MLEELNTLFSNIRKHKDPVIAGIDEAGRGPVIGPMVYAIYIMPESAVTSYKDSKMLSAAKRESFFSKMTDYAYIAVDPVYISCHMLTDSKNLNQIAKDTVLLLLNELRKNCSNVVGVYIDGLGNNTLYKQYLERYFNYKFTIENKADSTYQVVSGASIVAKVIRDGYVSKYACGSGYPSDPNTKEWLKRNVNFFLGFPKYVRHSWQTIRTILGEKKSKRMQKSLSSFYISPL